MCFSYYYYSGEKARLGRLKIQRWSYIEDRLGLAMARKLLIGEHTMILQIRTVPVPYFK